MSDQDRRTILGGGQYSVGVGYIGINAERRQLSSCTAWDIELQDVERAVVIAALRQCGIGGGGDRLRRESRRELDGRVRLQGIEIEYVEAVDAETLARHPSLDRPILIAIAARVGKTRLIDNVVLNP